MLCFANKLSFHLFFLQIEDAMLMFDKQTNRHRGMMIIAFFVFCAKVDAHTLFLLLLFRRLLMLMFGECIDCNIFY